MGRQIQHEYGGTVYVIDPGQASSNTMRSPVYAVMGYLWEYADLTNSIDSPWGVDAHLIRVNARKSSRILYPKSPQDGDLLPL